MVWGIALPKSFGEFWPSGEFEGWNERLVDHYVQQSFEGRKALFNYDGEGAATSYAYYVSQKFINEVGTKIRSEDPTFTAVRPYEAPISFIAEEKFKEFGSLIMLNDRILAVDGALKAVIERFEPEIHQFFPIEIKTPNGKVYPKDFYTLVIGQYFDSFLPEISQTGSFRPNGTKKYFPQETQKGMAGLAFSNTIFDDACLWRERRMGTRLTCFSDALIAEIESVGLKIPPHYVMMEI